MINGKKNTEEKTESKYTVKVTRAREIKKTEKEQVISFDVTVNYVTIYGMIYRSGVSKQGKDYEIISFPARKGSDDTYYNHCWFGISKDLQENIKEQIGGLLND